MLTFNVSHVLMIGFTIRAMGHGSSHFSDRLAIRQSGKARGNEAMGDDLCEPWNRKIPDSIV